MSEFNYKGYVVYTYTFGKRGSRKVALCIANPNHSYPYEAKGVTVCSGVQSVREAVSIIDGLGAA